MNLITEEDKVIAVLKDIPIFCVSRIYKEPAIEWTFINHIRKRYIFEFKNGIVVSVVEFRQYLHGNKYELMCSNESVVDQGDEYHMNNRLNNLEGLGDINFRRLSGFATKKNPNLP